MAASIEFIKGIKEPCVPDVKLTRSRDGSQGTATFVFSQPSVFEAGNELGEITGLYMNDDEGVITTTDVNAKFVNGARLATEWLRPARFLGFRGRVPPALPLSLLCSV